MKKLCSILALLVASQVYGLNWKTGWDGEVRLAAFHPTSKLFREIYSSWDAEPQFLLSKKLGWGLYGWASVGYFSSEGRTSFSGYESKIRMVPLSFGLHYLFFPEKRFHLYLGVGPSVNFVGIRDFSPYLNTHVRKESWGVVARSGLIYDMWKCLFVDLFADYLYQPLSTQSEDRSSEDIGGWKVGGGIGVHF
jgi:outer membrane protein